mgnify:CR=1 FL=1
MDLKLPDGYQFKRVECARMVNDALTLVFEDDTALTFADHGQSCCEDRYMTCELDDLDKLTGDRLISAEVLSAPDGVSEDEEHEVQFLHITFSSGYVLTCETHNEHNGFYGGFDVSIEAS